jgi:hypothetical protein
MFRLKSVAKRLLGKKQVDLYGLADWIVFDTHDRGHQASG